MRTRDVRFPVSQLWWIDRFSSSSSSFSPPIYLSTGLLLCMCGVSLLSRLRLHLNEQWHGMLHVCVCVVGCLLLSKRKSLLSLEDLQWIAFMFSLVFLFLSFFLFCIVHRCSFFFSFFLFFYITVDFSCQKPNFGTVYQKRKIWQRFTRQGEECFFPCQGKWPKKSGNDAERGLCNGGPRPIFEVGGGGGKRFLFLFRQM